MRVHASQHLLHLQLVQKEAALQPAGSAPAPRSAPRRAVGPRPRRPAAAPPPLPPSPACSTPALSGMHVQIVVLAVRRTAARFRLLHWTSGRFHVTAHLSRGVHTWPDSGPHTASLKSMRASRAATSCCSLDPSLVSTSATCSWNATPQSGSAHSGPALVAIWKPAEMPASMDCTTVLGAARLKCKTVAAAPDVVASPPLHARRRSVAAAAGRPTCTAWRCLRVERGCVSYQKGRCQVSCAVTARSSSMASRSAETGCAPVLW
jgi:hypothetical protein